MGYTPDMALFIVFVFTAGLASGWYLKGAFNANKNSDD